MTWLARVFAAALSLLLVLVLFGTFIISTENGLRWAYRLATMLAPADITVDELHGRLIGPLKLRGIHYTRGDTRVDIGRVELEWTSADLLSATLHIKRFVLDDFTLTYTEPPNQPKEPFTLPTIHLPFYLRADHIELNRLLVREHTQGTKFEMTQASLAANWRGDRGEIQQLTVHAPRYQISVSGSMESAADYPLDLQMHWRFDGANYAVWDGAGRVYGNLKTLNINQHIHAPIDFRVKGALTELVDAPAWELALATGDFNLRAIHATWPDMQINGLLRSSGKVKDLQARVSGTVRTRQANIPLTHRLDVGYQADSLIVYQLRSLYADTGTELSASGRITDLRTQPRASLAGDWRQLRWPLSGDPAVQSRGGSFSIDGGLEQYQLHVEGDVAGKHIPSSVWSAAATGNKDALTVSTLRGELLGGQLTGNGLVRWRPDIEIAANWRADAINPGVQWSAWPGAMHLAGNVSGGMLDGKLEIKLDVPDIQGQLLNHAFTGVGHARLHGRDIELSQFYLQSGENRVSASGRLDEEWDMAWSVTADELSVLLPDVSGVFHGGGHVGGPRAAPILTTSLRGEKLSLPDYAAAEVQVVASLDTGGEVPSTVDVAAAGLILKNHAFNRIALRLDGTRVMHTLHAEVDSPLATLESTAQGGYADQRWQGDLTRLNITGEHIGRWNLKNSSPIVAAKRGAQIDALCLVRAAADICASGQWQAAQGWQARTTGRALPLNLLLSFLPSNAIIRGDMGFDVQAEADAAGLITARFNVEAGAGAISEALMRRQDAIDVAFRGGRLAGSLDEAALKLNLAFDLEQGGTLNGDLRAARRGLPAPVGGGQVDDPTVLSGRFNANVTDITVLPLFIAALENTKGQLTAGMQVNGAWNAPQVMGEIKLADASADLPTLGITAQQINVSLRSHDRGHISIAGGARSGAGTLNLSGEARRNPANDWLTQLAIKGERVDVMRTAERRIVASPDLRLTLLRNRIDLTGEIMIPEAMIQPRELKGAVSASDDVIIMTGDGLPTAKGRWLIYSQVRVRLGDFVRFNGFGLKARLAGDILLKDEPEQPTTAAGELRVTEGEYRAYGQELTIDRGRLLFFGGQVDNPGLDVRAVRHVEEVTAGLLVRGTLKNPEVSVFSEPAMGETDALSYLVLGRPASQATRAESQQMTGAAAALGLLGGKLLSKQIGKRFGIDDVRIESGGGFGGGALVIRHYLSPKIYVSYGMGLFENLSVFVVRYQISKLWALQAESGTQSSGDIIYTIERE